jgi:catechol 2,3-dioxygenase-like lactoylglutathione lyase family enzyme
MTDEITIPLLPCHSIDAMLDFYRALGFEVTYQQAKPNLYAVVQRGGIELHFFTMKGYDPAGSYSSCYVRVTDVDGLYQAFIDGLRGRYGRVPSAGIPRVIPLKNKTGRREFIVVDPGGNWIRIGQPLESPAGDEDGAAGRGGTTKLSRALNAATLLSDAGQDEKAVKMLDAALADDGTETSAQRVQARVYRAGLAITMNDHGLARALLNEIRELPLEAGERETLTSELERADDLEHMLAASQPEKK